MTGYTQLTQEERYQIEALLAARVSQKEIAAQLGRSSASISRDVRRNHVDGVYSAAAAGRRPPRRWPDGTQVLVAGTIPVWTASHFA